jgi:microcystin-dependent protein
MSNPYIGEIRMFGGSFAPAGWAMCGGQQVAINQNDALFSLIGTTYGGDGVTTFNLPDLQGRAPMHRGLGPGISQTYVFGEKNGVESVTLNQAQTPIHNHSLVASGDSANQISGQNGVLAFPPTVAPYFTAPPDTALNANSVIGTGGSQPHENMQPFLVITFIISLFGVFPAS